MICLIFPCGLLVSHPFCSSSLKPFVLNAQNSLPCFSTRSITISWNLSCISFLMPLIVLYSSIKSCCLCDYGDSRIIVKLVGDDVKAQMDYSNKYIPPLTSTQQRLMTLVFALQSQHQQYKCLLEIILLGIEYRLFRLGFAPNVSIKLWCIVRKK